MQDPAEALFPGMPRAAIEQADPQLVAPLSALAIRLCAWLGELGGDTALPQAVADGQAKLPAGGTGDPTTT